MQEREKSSNKVIARNVVALFFRMAVTMGITLYSVRLLLDILGLEDYGVYTLVAGFVSMMTFLSQSMSISIQRFLSFAIGKGNIQELKRIFSVSTLIFLVISLVLLFVSETLGLWFVKNKLVIPKESYDAAIWLYHFSVITFCVSIFRIPYISVLLANEDMKLFAILNIMESFLKLVAIIILPLFSVNYLSLYGLLLLIATLISFSAHLFFTSRKYKEAVFKFYFDKTLFKSILTFSGWSLFGLLAGIGNNQGNNILINLFFGPVANAAREVAVQVQNAISAFSNSIYIAFKPQLIKSYAEENFKYMINLFYLSSKAIFFLDILICVPIYINTEFILNLWLTEVTQNMVVFVKLSLIYISIFALNNPITTLVQATGKIRRYAVIVETIIMVSLPLTYLFYKLDFPPESTFWVSIVIFSFAHIVRLFMLKELIEFSIIYYCKEFVLPSLLVMLGIVISYFGLEFFLSFFKLNNILYVITKTLILLIILFFISYMVMLSKSEKNAMKVFLSKYLKFIKV